MFAEFLIFFVVVCLMIPADPRKRIKSRYKEAGRKTYEHFQKAQTDEDMKNFLKANYQDLKEFEGLSRTTICDRMKWKAEQNGQEYTHWPY